MAPPVMDDASVPSYDFGAMMRPYRRPASWFRPLLGLLAPIVAAGAVGAQQLRGTIVDSTARTPIVGAVVETQDSAGAALSRGLTDEFGAYSIGRPADVKRLRVVRMGYRPRDVDVPDMSGSEQRLDLAMAMVPRFLEGVTATIAANCPKREDSQRAFALLEQARAGLLATIVSRQVNPPAIKLLLYERQSDGIGQRILRQSVRIDSSNAAMTSFSAARNAGAFVEDGFMLEAGGGRMYYGPDAEVMLDPKFAAAYCFRVRDGRSTSEIGLGFSPAHPRRNRVDIDGTLWLDTSAKVVSEIAFNYIGAPRSPQLRPGGEIHFHTMPNGAVFIDRWFLRMVDSRQDAASGAPGNDATRLYNFMRETGGEVARATWPDGRTWKASLATVRLRVVDRFNDKVTRAVVRLTDTDYLGSPDSSGTALIEDVLPGPYSVELQDSALVRQQVVLKSLTKFSAERGQLIVRTVTSPPVYAFFREACRQGATGKWIEFAAFDSAKKAMQVKWVLGEDLGGRMEHQHASGVTTRDGLFGYCRDHDLRVSLQVRVERLDDPFKAVLWDLPSEPGKRPWPIVLPLQVIAWR